MIQTQRIDVDRQQARELWREYRKHQHYSEPIDDEIRRTYQLIAQGRVVIRALESIKAAGLNDQGLPKLAIVRADAAECYLQMERDGSAIFSMTTGWGTHHHTRRRITLPPASFPPRERSVDPYHHMMALVPLVPIHLRPKRGLANYHILFEAEWERIVPKDPMLLRRIGQGDLWLVVAAWDLTEVERAALAARISA